MRQKLILSKEKLVIIIALLFTIVLCAWPMGLSPWYNGLWGRTVIYERFTESLLRGHLYIDYDDIDDKLYEMENPYDPDMREELGVEFHWDNAWYNGHYYMYFGIVPALVLFAPYQLITGNPLKSYIATQIFISIFIIFMFILFGYLRRKVYPKIPFAVYVSVCMASCFLSAWYCVDAPAMYCTPIAAGMACIVISIYCLMRAVYEDEYTSIYLFVGALFGALSFGCRPPLAMANIALVPLVFCVWRKIRLESKASIIRNIMCFIIPYVVVAILLMIYNYVRFDSFFEFGQAYQLTVRDQSNYGSISERFSIRKILKGLRKMFFEYKKPTDEFPYVRYSGIFYEFPLLLFCFSILWPKTCRKLRESKLLLFTISIIVSIFVIVMAEVMMSPYLLERYKLDIWYLMCILSYILIGCLYQTIKSEKVKKCLTVLVVFLSIEAFVMSVLLFMVPYDGNITSLDLRILDTIRGFLSF